MGRSRAAPPDVLTTVQAEYEQRIRELEQAIAAVHVGREEIHQEELHRARRHLLLIEKERIIEANHRGTLDPETNSKLMADVDARLLRLEAIKNDATKTPAETDDSDPSKV